ncbi:YfaP family protein [Teredinibacter turnerae]|uniref:Lipoprotein n=1 Tax=Teredinibacter turnerae (strain ATCC 39867 / T7901) TaxID=377629 RepID=C5BNR4_TERTT|nr:lipoprotein [Teredinibacter turnerae]ACR13332.1 putative lipoprotein [Teredinibacter turnerae T7901]
MFISKLGMLRSVAFGGFFALLAACGGSSDIGTSSGDGSSTSSSGAPGGTPTSQQVVVLMRGLRGELQLSAGGQTFSINTNGYVPLRNLPLGELTGAIGAFPDQQQCLFTETQMLTSPLDSETVAVIECDDLLTLTGKILQPGTETPLPGAVVTVRGYTDSAEPVTLVSDTVGDDGIYLLDDILLIGFSRMTLTIEHPDYELFSLPISDSPSELYQDKNYTPTDPANSATFSPTEDQALTLGTVEIDLPSNSLRTKSGEIPTGMVTVRTSPLDASFAPELLPGAYLNSEDEALESFGAASVRFFLGDEELVFAENAAATIRFPIAVRAQGSAPASEQAYYFDRESGYWVAAGMAAISGTADYELTADRSTVWGVFSSYPTVNIKGCVRDMNGNPVKDTLIITQGQSYIGRLLDYTDKYGTYSVRARTNSTVFLYARSDVASQTFSVTTETADVIRSSCLVVDPNTTTITLTWGENPADIDSHLYGPNGSGGNFHIYYAAKQTTVNNTTVYLDVDDVTSYGPEVITIPRFPSAGTYRFYTHLFSGSSNMFASPTRIALFTGRVEYVYFVTEAPGTTGTRCWHVFDIEVDDALTPTVVEQSKYVSDTFCSGNAN